MLNMAEQEKEKPIENTESLGSGTSKLPVAVDKALSLNGFVQSWYLTKMRYDFSLIEKNIFLKIVEKGQKFIKKEYLGKNCNVEIEMGFSGEEATVTFPISEIAGKSHNYQLIKENLVSLSEKRFGLPIDEGWDFSEMYLFSKIESSKQKGLMRVKLTNEFWKAFYNLKVFKVIDPNVAYKFRSVYTERIYELLVGNSTVITFELKHIRTMFCLENKYASNYDFINRVIKSSQKEMKELEDCPFYFEYELGYEGRTAKNISFRVIDKAKANMRERNLQALKEDAEGVLLNDVVKDCIRRYFPRMTMRDDVELKMKRAQKNLGVKGFCDKIEELYVKAKSLKDNGQLKGTMSSYFIGSLDRIAEEKRVEERAKHIFSGNIQDVIPVKEIAEDPGYKYLSNLDVVEKSKTLGLSVEEFIKTYKLERVDDETWRYSY